MTKNRRIVIVRHGERVDFVFTDEWMTSCFLDGEYKKQNLNQPDTVPKREGSPNSFIRDCPLTEVGVLQATLTGKGLLAEKVLSDGFEVIVSPALRSIQTATGIAKGMGVDFSLNVEPGLFEWTGWFADFMPKWMTVEEHLESGVNVNSSYVPFLGTSEIIQGEKEDDFYRRTHSLILHLLGQTDKDLLLVAHGASLDAATRQLTGEPIRKPSDMMALVRAVSYCGVAVAEGCPQTNKWSVIPVPRIALRHSGVQDFEAAKAFSSKQCMVPESSSDLGTSTGSGRPHRFHN